MSKDDNFELQFPATFDQNNDNVSISVFLAGAADFLEYVESTKKI